MTTPFDPAAWGDDVFIGAHELAQWLGKSPATVVSDVTRRPDTLPPVVRLPGSNRPRWRVGDVRVWLNQSMPVL